jgi:hypothetical protein
VNAPNTDASQKGETNEQHQNATKSVVQKDQATFSTTHQVTPHFYCVLKGHILTMKVLPAILTVYLEGTFQIRMCSSCALRIVKSYPLGLHLTL